MGVPTSEVGYTPAMPRREDHEVHKGHVVALEMKKNSGTFQPLKMRTVGGLEIPGSDYPVIRRHVTENRNSQLL